MNLLLLLWWMSLLLAMIAIAWMLGLIVARLFREKDEARRGADRKALASAYLAIMGGAGDAAIVLQPFQRRARLLAETLLEVLGLVRGAERERLIDSLAGVGVDQRLRARLTRGSRTGRLAAAEALSAFPSPETRAALETLYRDARDPELRIPAVRTLIEIGAAPAPETLIADLEKRYEADSLLYVPVFRRLAVDAPDAMLAAFRSANLRPATRAVVAEALGASGDYRSVAALLDQADAADVVLRAAVVRAPAHSDTRPPRQRLSRRSAIPNGMFVRKPASPRAVSGRHLSPSRWRVPCPTVSGGYASGPRRPCPPWASWVAKR